MAIVYVWDCKTVDCYPTDGNYTDVVYNVHWIVTGTSDQKDPDDNFYTARIIGVHADLTNSDVVSWTKAAMGSAQVTEIETEIQSTINNEINPSSVTLTVKD